MLLSESRCRLTLTAAFLSAFFALSAQSPNAIPYQAVARNNSGNLLQNQPVRVRFSIHEGTASGSVVYQETHTATTNNLGLFSVNIGQGTPVSGTFAGINWGSGLKFTQVELDPSGGTAYLDMGTVQMLSVPYALYAASSGSVANESDPQVSSATNNAVPKWNGTTLTDGSLFDNGTNVGIGTAAPSQKLDIVGTVKTVGFQMPTGATNGYVLKTDANGNAVWAAPSSVFTDTDGQTLSLVGTTLSIDGGNSVDIFQKMLRDADADTKVEVEKNTDEDKIRFTLGGTEYFEMKGPHLNVKNSGGSVFVGEYAGQNDDLDASDNVGIGTYALSANTTGFLNTALGKSALASNISGTYNVAVGNNALNSITTTGLNTAIGSSAGANATGTANVFIGYGAGENETGNDKLYIHNSNVTNPLIWGDFVTRYLNINGNLGIGTTTPSQKLDVVGTVKTEGFQMPTGANDGYILQTDDNGNAAWADLANVETDPKVGSLDENYLPKWNGTVLANGQIYDNGNKIGVGTDSPVHKFHVESDLPSTNALYSSYSGNASGTDWAGGNNYAGVSGVTQTTDNAAFQAGVYGYVGGNGPNSGGVVGAWSDGTWAGLGYRDGSNDDWGLYVIGGSALEGRLRIQNGTQAEGYVLRSDADGFAEWIAPTDAFTENDPKVGDLSDNYMPRWNGSELTDGQLYDSGDKVGIGTDDPEHKVHITCDLPNINGLYSSYAGNASGTDWSGGNNYAAVSGVTQTADNASFQAGVYGYASGSATNSGGVVGAWSSSTWAGLGYRDDNYDDWGLYAVGATALQGALRIQNGTQADGYILRSDANGFAEWVSPGDALAESDPQVGDLSDNYMPRWNGSELTDGQLYDNGTNVGIGTNTPTEKLEVAGDVRSNGGEIYIYDNSQTFTMRTNAANNYVQLDVGGTGHSSDAIYIGDVSTTTNEVIMMGKVGIGTSSPSKAKLEISGSATYPTNGTSYGYLNNAGTTGTSTTNSTLYSIYASSRIGAAEFNAFSDARIKNIKGISNSQSDLSALMQLKITDYTLIDTVEKGTKPFKKVIAQEVERVYPQAVSKMTDVVPDIYKVANIENGFVALDKTNVKVGERVKLIFGEKQTIVEVTAVSEKGFQTNLTTEHGQVFVYGREVSDFRTVDYEAISMLNVSATQELNKQMEALKIQNATLQNRLKALETLNKRVEALEAMLGNK